MIKLFNSFQAVEHLLVTLFVSLLLHVATPITDD